ncbi:hypothetical protein P171DRAFT_226535 [Karstenula rhodostoma CBS 690.94]|uniref:Uncharacterized protein n=1 Tax=Karstenula rhodostoma CBS 690.94 TaxID=1392251 RepID=A0A9P4PQH8_9PLEO|nr:hypothetical protein P171DRAFT_226535 [Karstenula rhodostoma CBS 690.94]
MPCHAAFAGSPGRPSACMQRPSPPGLLTSRPMCLDALQLLCPRGSRAAHASLQLPVPRRWAGSGHTALRFGGLATQTRLSKPPGAHIHLFRRACICSQPRAHTNIEWLGPESQSLHVGPPIPLGGTWEVPTRCWDALTRRVNFRLHMPFTRRCLLCIPPPSTSRPRIAQPAHERTSCCILGCTHQAEYSERQPVLHGERSVPSPHPLPDGHVRHTRCSRELPASCSAGGTREKPPECMHGWESGHRSRPAHEKAPNRYMQY